MSTNEIHSQLQELQLTRYLLFLYIA